MNLVLKLSKSKTGVLPYALWYFIFTIVALGVDSVWFSKAYFEGRWVVNLMTIAYFSLIYRASDVYLRKLMIVMLALSTIGEIIFCSLLGMYLYKGVHIPIYVPLGHSIVYAAGYTLAQTKVVIRNTASLKIWFNIIFALLFIGVTLFLKDYFSLISGVLFFVLLNKKNWNLKYSCIAFCVIYIELLGTSFGCWTWVPKIFGVIPTVNPPLGAIFIYAGGDVLLAKLVDMYWREKA